MELGTVTSFDVVKGFGFVACDHGGRDVFLHMRALPPGVVPSVGDRVRFDVAMRDRGAYATHADLVASVSSR